MLVAEAALTPAAQLVVRVLVEATPRQETVVLLLAAVSVVLAAWSTWIRVRPVHSVHNKLLTDRYRR